MGRRIWVIGGVAAIAAVLGLGWTLGVWPLLNQAAAADEQRSTVEMQNAALEARLIQMADQFDRLAELEAQLDAVQGSVPDTPALDDFWESLDRSAADAGVVIASISAGEAVDYGVAAEGATDGAAEAGTPIAGVFTIPFAVTAKGGPDAAARFVAAVQGGTRLALVTNVGFTQEDSGTVSLSGHLFVIPETAPPAAPTP